MKVNLSQEEYQRYLQQGCERLQELKPRIILDWKDRRRRYLAAVGRRESPWAGRIARRLARRGPGRMRVRTFLMSFPIPEISGEVLGRGEGGGSIYHSPLSLQIMAQIQQGSRNALGTQSQGEDYRLSCEPPLHGYPKSRCVDVTTGVHALIKSALAKVRGGAGVEGRVGE